MTQQTKIVTHKSHFGIDEVVFYDDTDTVHMVSRNKSDLIKMTCALGMNLVEKYYEIVEVDSPVVITNSKNETSRTYKTGESDFGRIAKWDLDGNWFLQIKLDFYKKNFAKSFNP